MIHFKTINPHDRLPNSKLYAIDCDPTLKYEIYLYANKVDVSFEECIHIYEKSLNKTNYLGAMSLIYFKYYKEFYEYLLNKRNNSSFKDRKIRKFKTRYLDRWIEFVKRSDDSLCPQNEYFRKMEDLFSERKAKCPCCGYYTCDPYNLGCYDICPVCFWEDESAENDNPEEVSEVNHISLVEARKNFIEFGACKKEMLKYVRKPNDDEKEENQ